jgi:Kelch motif/Fibronectin type III domain
VAAVMKMNRSFPFRCLTGIAPLFVGVGLCAAPLTWFPGPSLGAPRSGAATTVFSGGNNLLIGGDSSAVQELAATNVYWTYLTTFSNSTLAPGAVASGGMIIFYGGNNGTSSTSAVFGYRRSDGSAPLASMRVARSHLGYAPDRNGNAYALGGLGASGQPLSSAESYSQDSSTWAAIASLPTALYDFPAVFDRTNYIYTFGGFTDTASGTETATVLRYSVSANTWTAMAPMPIAVAGSAAALGPDGKFYVVGGTSGGVTTNLVQVYTGNPQPTYLLVNGPTGMRVDTDSGAITWTPQGLDQVGAIPVTVRATNYAGYVDWKLTITVPNPPPATPTNLYMLSATEDTVTLAWNPESPVVGPATFNVFIPHPWHSPRGSGGGFNYQLVGSSTSTNVTIGNLAPNTSYFFDVKATASGGTSGYAGISVTTLGPQPPTHVRVTGITSTSISLSWDPSPGPVPVTRYEILGWIGGLFPTIGYGTNFTGTTATITGLTAGTYEEWSLRAYDAGGNVSGFASGIYAVNPVAAAARLSGAAPSASGGFRFTLSEGGNSLQTVLIQATTNPADPSSWVQIGSLMPSTSPFTFADTNASLFPMRFYRVVSP